MTVTLDRLLQEAETVPYLASTLAAALKDSMSESPLPCLPTCLKFTLAKLLLFGPAAKKDLLLSWGADRCVQGLVAEGVSFLKPAVLAETSDRLAAAEARSATMIFLVGGWVQEDDFSELLKEMWRLEDESTGGKTRFFDNSQVHLVKMRSLQALLMMSKCLSPETASMALKRVVNSLMKDNLNLSLRRMSEWILATLAILYPDLRRELSEAKKGASKDRVNAVPSFMLADTMAVERAGSEEDADALVKDISPWCMWHQFKPRLTAQVCMRRLRNKFPYLSTENAALVDCVEAALAVGDAEKNKKSLEDDFFLSNFNPMENFTVEDVICNLPRLSGVDETEWDCLEAFQRQSWPSFVTIRGQCNAIPCPTVKQDELMSSNDSLEPSSGAIQKKITPWQNPDAAEGSRVKSTPALPHLNVVASLIDRLPNLGGLCRTCEIFGAALYVLPSTAMSNEKEFQNTSVTAERWVNLAGVPADDLPSWLAKKRREEGMSVVAVEQASGSVSLDKFHFPEKTLLLLGNEKEGLPVHLLQEVDHCVEIPQAGVVRSLNVHVTAAIVIWEYYQQWNNKKA